MNKPLATDNMAQDNGASNFNRPTKLAHIVYRTRRFERISPIRGRLAEFL
ncbi:MAG: hypothetical protein ABIV48_07700 [Pyrinomonadaceae bacterium]